MTFLEPGDPTDLCERVASALRDLTGRAPDVVARAPGRVNLMGEHTDYNAGLVLPVALPHATWAAAARRDDDRVRIRSLQQDDGFDGPLDQTGPGGPRGWTGYAAGVLWALRRSGADLPGMDIVVTSTVPIGAGLSSSAALECAVAMAALGLVGDPDPDLAVEAAIAAETEVVGAPTGGMDQTVCVHAQAGAALEVDFESGAHRAVPLPLEDLGLALLVTDTRVSHALVDGGYAARRADCEEAARRLGVPTLRQADPQQVETLDDDRLRRRARHITTEIDRVTRTVDALAADDRAALGRLLLASHVSMRDDFEISCPELDAAVETAVEAGAVGARMTGGGFGGSSVALVPHERLEAVARAIDARFVLEGFTAPHHLRVDPAAGAGLV